MSTPLGFLGYSSDGRNVRLFVVAGDRIKPQKEAPTDEERIKLHKSMIAYAGTYTIDGGKAVHHVDIFGANWRLEPEPIRSDSTS